MCCSSAVGASSFTRKVTGNSNKFVVVASKTADVAVHVYVELISKSLVELINLLVY